MLIRQGLRATIDPIGTNAGIKTTQETNIMMASIVLLSSPVDESVGAYSFLSLDRRRSVNLALELIFNANLTNQQQMVFDKYQATKTFIALITLDLQLISPLFQHNIAPLTSDASAFSRAEDFFLVVGS